MKDLATGWSWARIEEIADTSSGGTPSRRLAGYFGGDIPWLKSGELRDGPVIGETEEYLTRAGLENCNAKILNPGTILVAMYGATTGRLGLLTSAATTNQAVCAIKVRDGIEPRFLFYLLLHLRRFLLSSRSGGAQPNINQGLIAGLRVPVPPSQEQRRIVAEIEKQLSHLEAAITSTRDAGGRTASLRSAILENVFSRPGYPLVPLGTLISSGPQNGIYKPSEAYGTGTPIIRIDDFQDQFLRDRSALRTLALDPDELSTYGLHIADLVINRVNSMTHLGKCFVVPEGICPAVFESNMMRLSLIPSVTPRWVALYLQSPSGRGRLVQNAKQAVNQASINQRDVCSTPVPMPQSTQEQARQVERLEMRLDSVRAFRTVCDLAQTRAARLRQAILKKAFEGKLVPQDPHDEPASALLERIGAARG